MPLEFLTLMGSGLRMVLLSPPRAKVPSGALPQPQTLPSAYRAREWEEPLEIMGMATLGE